jgi:hypothetical protein
VNDSPNIDATHHGKLLRPFLERSVRPQFAEINPESKKRVRLLNRLAHQYETTLDWRFAQPIPPAEQTPDRITKLLRNHGATATCYVLCCSDRFDSLWMPL